MELKDMALQYRESARLCYDRAVELRAKLRHSPTFGTETVALRRRISMLERMAKETRATGKYLENYYRRNEDDGQNSKKPAIHEGDGVFELEELRKAMRAAGKQRRRTCGGRSGAGADPASEANGKNVLH